MMITWKHIFTSALLVQVLTSVLAEQEKAEKENDKKDDRKNILIFGGNGFIGSTVVHKLLDDDKYNIILLHRGQWSWDTAETIKPFVTSIKCDRGDPNTWAMKVEEDEQIAGKKFHAVIDFSAYHAEDIKPFYEWLIKAVTGPYIYISGDSVFEVSEKEGIKVPITEEMAKRCSDKEVQQGLNVQYAYAHHKLRAEEYLARRAKKGELPYVTLRMPDVIGPRDNTRRFWKYIMWIEYANDQYPIPIPEDLTDVQSSYAYSEDVATAIKRILDIDTDEEKKKVFNQTYHLAFDEYVTLHDFFQLMGKALGVKEVKVETADRSVILGYPSITQGYLSIEKAEKLLEFRPTSMKKAFAETVEFFKEAMYKFPTERDPIFEDLKNKLRRIDNNEGKLGAVKEKYKADLYGDKAEL